MLAEPPLTPLDRALRAGLSTWLGFALVALTNALFITLRLPRPPSLWLRAQHHLFDAAGVLGLGLVAALVVGAGTLLVERTTRELGRWWLWASLALGGYAAITSVILFELVGYELERLANSRFGGRHHALVYTLGAAALTFAVPAAHVAGALVSRRSILRIVALGVALFVMVANHLVLRDDYAGLHGALAWLAATLGGQAAASFAFAARYRIRPRAGKMLLAFGLGAGLFGIAVAPPVSVRIELFREPGAISAWAFARTIWRLPGDPYAVPPSEALGSIYFHPLEDLLPTPPTTPPLLAGRAPLVVLITLDAVRADAIDREQNEAHFPTITRLKKEGASFTRATSPGSQTAVSLSSMFSGRYFSQLVFRDHGRGPTRFLYPATDPSPRFPELLARQGVKTASFCSLTFLTNEFGVARGFVEETVVTEGRRHAHAEQVMKPLLERLRRAGDEPLFLYAHLLEPHAPYDRGGKTGPASQRYLAEIGVADRWLGELVALLEARFLDRAYLIVTSDHGEAFGEHGTLKHSKTLYEELLRIPLLVRGPGVAARRIEEHVTLVDLGPTILDLFGVETPSTFLGQSLVPLLAGHDVRLERPVLAEGRLRRVLYWEGLKVIDDPRRKVVEVFDLSQDPREKRNLFDVDHARAQPALSALRLFFEAHHASAPGYEPPYKP
ncbi:sulfatase [Polyangium spumosum]|uniref:Sulfatase-like hydrolase/transferase n=1 Tax=Polyangium spumosum TaxID=889282 RepID=A0A6N7Q128_9BACT|nr:sulfatase [Polyangium spumosum]MRG96295.1 sulfatase-like hydrolase/transferase [Polyangium spumosum]